MYSRRNWIGTSDAIAFFSDTHRHEKCQAVTNIDGQIEAILINDTEIKIEDFPYHNITAVTFFLKTTRYTPPLEDN